MVNGFQYIDNNKIGKLVEAATPKVKPTKNATFIFSNRIPNTTAIKPNTIVAQEAFKSDDLEQRLEAEQKAAQAKALAVQANKLDKGKTGLRTRWEAEITNRKDALLHYIKVKPEAFEALVKELAQSDARNEATRRDIPGVKFNEIKEAW